MFGPKKCTDGGSHHNFQARYDYFSELPDGLIVRGFSHHPITIELLKTTKKTYVHDICVWCGAIVERPRSGSVSEES